MYLRTASFYVGHTDTHFITKVMQHWARIVLYLGGWPPKWQVCWVMLEDVPASCSLVRKPSGVIPASLCAISQNTWKKAHEKSIQKIASTNLCLISQNVSEIETSPSQVVSNVRVEATALRRDPLYYKIYCIALNTVFASIIPVVSLFYFNVYTVIGELKENKFVPIPCPCSSFKGLSFLCHSVTQ
jgi:hypothetical protein